jgi:hypothetical protein
MSDEENDQKIQIWISSPADWIQLLKRAREEEAHAGTDETLTWYELPFTPIVGNGFRTLSALGFEEFP